ncbi:MAG: hypothetical protein Q7R78_02885 [bacterium]|nr:hypothetical protein [bacterium]
MQNMMIDKKDLSYSIESLKTYDCTGSVYGFVADYPRGSVLENYKKDIHIMLMGRLNSFMSSNECDEETPIKLRNLLEEIIKVQLLLNCSKDE